MKSLLVFCFIFTLVGCGGGGAKQTDAPSLELLVDRVPKKIKDPTPEQEAILRVMEEDRAKLKEGYAKFSTTSQPPVVDLMAKQYIEYLEKADVKDCMQAFKLARANYIGGWKKFQKAIHPLAPQYEGSDFMTDLIAIFKTDGEKGKSLGGDLIEAAKKLKSSYDAMFKAAEELGIES